MSINKINVVLVTNIPAPYRLSVLEELSDYPDITLNVLFCSGREPDRDWNLRPSRFKQTYLKEKYWKVRGKYIHSNPDVWPVLRAMKPDVLITTGFNPTFLLAYLYAKTHGVRHIPMTDGTLTTEQELSFLHNWMRRLVFMGSDAFVGASLGSFDLYRSYGVAEKLLFQSHLCADNSLYDPAPLKNKTFDLVYSGRFVLGKNPIFAMTVACKVAVLMKKRIRLLCLGSGDMLEEMQTYAKKIEAQVDTVFAGFVAQEDLPKAYASAKVFLFPSQMDTWGVVANEACAAGLPVLVSPMAGVANELVVHQTNGYVLPLVEEQWVEACVHLLSDDALYQAFSLRSSQLVQTYTYASAAKGLYAAIHKAISIGFSRGKAGE